VCVVNNAYQYKKKYRLETWTTKCNKKKRSREDVPTSFFISQDDIFQSFFLREIGEGEGGLGDKKRHLQASVGGCEVCGNTCKAKPTAC
jgi:hypothetical protein